MLSSSKDVATVRVAQLFGHHPVHQTDVGLAHGEGGACCLTGNFISGRLPGTFKSSLRFH